MGGGNEVSDGQLERGSRGGIVTEVGFAMYEILFSIAMKLSMIYQTESFPSFLISD